MAPYHTIRSSMTSSADARSLPDGNGAAEFAEGFGLLLDQACVAFVCGFADGDRHGDVAQRCGLEEGFQSVRPLLAEARRRYKNGFRRGFEVASEQGLAIARADDAARRPVIAFRRASS